MMTSWFPQRVLVIGASGPIGCALVSNLLELQYVGADRIVLLERDRESGYAPIASGHLEGMALDVLHPWLREAPDAVVYLAGVRAEVARAEPALGRELHVTGFGRVLEAMAVSRNPAVVVYASSTAILGPKSAYGDQKAEAEALLLASDVAGASLRFPTVLPRGSAHASTAFLDEAVQRLSSGRPFRWPIAADRRVRLMSTAMAAHHIAVAIKLGMAVGRRILDLPATIATPRDLCSAVGDGAPDVVIQQDLDAALASRIVDIDSSEAARLGFPAAEALDQLLFAAKSQLWVS